MWSTIWLVAGMTLAQGQTVVGGGPAEAGVWDDAVAVRLGNQWGCTGVLIAPDLVITAGHCVRGVNVTRVKIGALDSRGDGEEINVVEAIEYPNSQRTIDVALLMLESDSVHTPRDMALDCVVDNDLHDGAPVAVVGFGSDRPSGGGNNSLLLEAFTTVTDHDCSEGGQSCNRDARPDGELTSGGDGIDSCSGDSGGPLYLLTDRGDFLTGITSRGTGWTCGDGGVYGRVDKVIDWIETEYGDTLPRPNCDPNTAPSPFADGIEVYPGESGTTIVDPGDPDAVDSHEFWIDTDPAHGTAEIDDSGELVYTADADYIGEDTVRVGVGDNGYPAEERMVEVPVDVLDPNAPAGGGDGDGSLDGEGGPGGCACSADVGKGPTAPFGGVVGILALMGLVRRRS